jgi:mediator of RNA polymerase II transcription subunit 17, fungi type
MGSLPNGFPVSLKSWPSKPNDATALPTLIQRINLERGGFVNISEESLQQEIAQAEAGDSGECNGSSDEEEAEEPDRAKELMAAREEMVGQIEYAASCHRINRC